MGVTFPACRPLDPSRTVRRTQLRALSAHRDGLTDSVGNDRHIWGRSDHLDLVESVGVEGPAAVLRHLAHHCLVDATDAPRSRDKAGRTRKLGRAASIL